MKNILLVSSSNRQEQIQEIISENIQECEILKYICASNTLPSNPVIKRKYLFRSNL